MVVHRKLSRRDGAGTVCFMRFTYYAVALSRVCWRNNKRDRESDFNSGWIHRERSKSFRIYPLSRLSRVTWQFLIHHLAENRFLCMAHDARTGALIERLVLILRCDSRA